MSERVARLRERSQNATPTLSTERAQLLTEFYKQNQEPLSEPVRRAPTGTGPTAVTKSVTKMDHVCTGGRLLNQKLTPVLLEDEDDLDKFAQLIRAYFRMGGHHVQFNVVDAATLRAAQAHPERYRNLIVRVARYSDYFCDLGRALQDEIIARTEHQSYSVDRPLRRRQKPGHRVRAFALFALRLVGSWLISDVPAKRASNRRTDRSRLRGPRPWVPEGQRSSRGSGASHLPGDD